MNQRYPRSQQEHRPLRRADFEGKTIHEVDVRAVNIIRFYFTDGSSIAIEHERDGMVACDVCATRDHIKGVERTGARKDGR